MGRKPTKLYRNTAGIIFALLILPFAPTAAQNVMLTKVEHSNDNKSKVLYRIPSADQKSEYLGEAEISLAGAKTDEVFAEFYKKSKKIGANSYTLRQDSLSKAGIQRLTLYYTPETAIPLEDNTFYLLSTAPKPKKIVVNDRNLILQPDTYLRIKLSPGGQATISTQKFLGSSVRFIYSDSQPPRYFLLTAARLSENPDGSPGLRLKTGDITALETSYAQFMMIGWLPAKDY